MRSQRQNGSHPRTARCCGAGFTLIGTLIVIVIICILAVILIPRLISPTKDPVTGARVPPPRERAKQVETVVYIGQINQAIQMYKMDHDNQNPQSLAELKTYGVTDDMMKDAVTHQYLPYDPRTGQVGKSTGPDGLGGGGDLPRVHGF